jgi:hypothetical protein
VEETEGTGGESTETTGQSAGQSETSVQTTVNGTEQTGESFFDYESVKGKPELEAAYKEMQRAFSKKTEGIKGSADKISQYDQFMANPVETMQRLATQYGYQMVQGQAQADDGTPKQYNNWDEVKADFKESIRAEVMDELKPVFGELQTIKKQNVEQTLDNSHPDWRTYEDSMLKTLQAHPSLVGDPDMLYRMSVPEEVLNARATKAALAKINGTTSNTVQGQSTTTQQVTKKPKFNSINEAAAWAAQQPQVKSLKI